MICSFFFILSLTLPYLVPLLCSAVWDRSSRGRITPLKSELIYTSELFHPLLCSSQRVNSLSFLSWGTDERSWQITDLLD